MATTPDPQLESWADRMRPRSASNLLLWLILGFFVAFVAWAALTELDRTVRASGRVIPSARLQVISSYEGGVIDAILVRAGDTVRHRQPLVRLSPAQPEADLGSSLSTISSLRAKIARLQAEVTGRSPNFAQPRNAAEALQIDIERSLYRSRLAELASLSEQARARATSASRAIAEAEASYQSRLSARDSAQAQVRLIRPLVDRGIEPRMSLLQLESQAAIAGSDAVQAQAAIARARANAAEAQAAVSSVRRDWLSQSASELAAAQADLAARSRTTGALEERVERSSLMSPVDGKVNRVLVNTVGSSVAPNQPIIEVVPSADALTVEAMVNPKDIAAVHVGQNARINISAYDSAVFGSMEGEVISVSPDATVNEQTGESFYTVRVRTLADTLRDQQGRRLPIGPGMTADVSLLGEKRSILSYLLTPITRLSESAFRE